MKIKLLIPIVVLSLSVAFVSISIRAANNDHETDEKKNPNSSKTPGRKIEPKGNNVTSEECEVRSGDIARFANGEVYNFGAVVSLVAKPSCAVMSNSLVINELSQGINFNRVPFHLDEFSKGFSSLTVEGKKKVELGIDRNLRTQLNAENYSNKELLPVLGQLALLSPKAARSTLAYLITQELIAQELEGKQGLVNGRDVSSAVDTISILKRFGADEPLIVQELSADVEEMASNSQADSLGKVLTGLALAAREVDAFALAFNSSAGAFNRGVRQSNNDYTADERNSLLKAGFSVANASVGYSPSIEPGAQEVNEALKVLLRGAALDETSLKNVWRKVVEVTAASSGQTALAQALALSLTSNVIFLSKSDRDSLLSSAKIHGSVAEAIQLAFLEAWKESREQLLSKKLKITAFNERKDKFFEAWVKGILDLEPEFVRAGWLQEVIQRGLVKDEEIQNKVPKFVLALFESQESSAKKMVIEEKVEPWMISAMTSFGVLWNLSQVHIPVLENWSKKHEND